MSIENTLKEAGFTEKQVFVLTPVFEKAQQPPVESLIVKLEIRLIRWMIGLIIILAGLIYFAIYTPLNTRITSVGISLNQRITSVETSLNQRIDGLKTDVAENKAMIQRVLEKLDDLENQINRSSK